MLIFEQWLLYKAIENTLLNFNEATCAVIQVSHREYFPGKCWNFFYCLDLPFQALCRSVYFYLAVIVQVQYRTESLVQLKK